MKRNIIINYLSQIYVTIVAVVFLPVYMSYLGHAAYGVVAFFSTLQVAFNILDVGLTPTVSRQTVLHSSGAYGRDRYFRFLKSICCVFVLIAILGAMIIYGSSEYLVIRWLNVENLNTESVLFSVKAMGACVAAKWLSGFYRGILIGRERVDISSAVNFFVATMKFVVVIPVLDYLGRQLEVFFLYQIFVSVIELLVLYLMSSKVVSNYSYMFRSEFSFIEIKKIASFSGSIGFTAFVWVLYSQIDKFLLSGMLDISKYGYYTLAVMVASTITTMTGPIATSLMPRLAALHSQGKDSDFKLLYLKFSRYIFVLTGIIALSFFINAEHILYLWTKDDTVVTEGTLVLKYYSLGNFFLAMSAFPYYYQFALGKVKLHTYGTIMSFLLYVPMLFGLSQIYGALGAAFSWMIINFLYLSIWCTYSHFKLNRSFMRGWLFDLLIKSSLIPIFCVFVITRISEYVHVENTMEMLLWIALTTIMIILSFIYNKKSWFKI